MSFDALHIQRKSGRPNLQLHHNFQLKLFLEFRLYFQIFWARRAKPTSWLQLHHNFQLKLFLEFQIFWATLPDFIEIFILISKTRFCISQPEISPNDGMSSYCMFIVVHISFVSKGCAQRESPSTR